MQFYIRNRYALASKAETLFCGDSALAGKGSCGPIRNRKVSGSHLTKIISAVNLSFYCLNVSNIHVRLNPYFS